MIKTISLLFLQLFYFATIASASEEAPALEAHAPPPRLLRPCVRCSSTPCICEVKKGRRLSYVCACNHAYNDVFGIHSDVSSILRQGNFEEFFEAESEEITPILLKNLYRKISSKADVKEKVESKPKEEVDFRSKESVKHI